MMQIWLRWKNSSCLCLLVINNKERKWNTHRTYKTGKIDVFLFIMSTASFYFMSMFVADKCVLTGFNEYSEPVSFEAARIWLQKNFSLFHRTSDTDEKLYSNSLFDIYFMLYEDWFQPSAVYHHRFFQLSFCVCLWAITKLCSIYNFKWFDFVALV